MERIDIDHNDASFLANRHERYAELRRQCPVVYNEHYDGYWLVTDFESVAEVARDAETYAHKYEMGAEDGIDYHGICGVPRIKGTPRQGVSEVDGPFHHDLRRALGPFFAPPAVEALRPRMDHICRWFVDEIIESGEADLVLDFTTPVPAVLTLDMMGLPSENWHHYAEFFHATSSYDHNSPEYHEAVARWPLMREELAEHAEACRADPGEDVTSFLVGCELDGQPLTDDHILDIMWNLVAGGLDTTTSLTSWALHHLGTHPDDRARLVEDPSLIPVAIEEFLRFYSPNETLARTVARDTELGGEQLRAGDRLLVSWVSANHDEQVFDRADEIVIDREPNRHLAFGLGPHRCIGSTFARATAEVMLSTFLERIPDYTIDEDRFTPYPGNALMTGVVSMPATFPPGTRDPEVTSPF